MSRIVLALALLTVTLGLSQSASADNVPIWPNRCSSASSNNSPASTRACVLNGVVSGRTVVIEASDQATSDAVTSSGGETVTCPAGAVGLNVTPAIRTRVCYIVLGSSHATLTVTLTATGGAAIAYAILAHEVQGLGAVDAGSASGANAHSVSTTTAGTNEIVFASCRGFANEIAPGSGFAQVGFAMSVGIGNQEDRTLSESQVVAAASTITSACTFTNDAASSVIAALAFSISGAPAPPLVNRGQWCEINIDGLSNGSQNCALHNTASGSKALVSVMMSSNGTAFTISATCTEACTLPANAQNTAIVYGGVNVVLGVGYADMSSTHASFTVQPNKLGGSGNNETRYIWVEEVTGINTGVDTPSAAAATAATVNYTTAANNEYTICAAGDNAANPMSPGGSFNQMGQAQAVITPVQQALFMQQTTATAGSNTCSYSITGSTQPLIATLSFGLPATGSNTPAHSVIIDFHPRSTPFKRLPWIDRRAKLRIITI